MLIDKIKELFVETESKLQRESDAENRYLYLLDKTYEENSTNQITISSGPGSWRSILMKLYNFKKELSDKNYDRYFTFVGMEEGGFDAFISYLESHKHDKIWNKLLYGHNDTDEFQQDIKNIYRRAIYYHKFERSKDNKILFANKRIYSEVIHRILLNKSKFVLDEAEQHLIKYSAQNALTEQMLNELLDAPKDNLALVE